MEFPCKAIALWPPRLGAQLMQQVSTDFSKLRAGPSLGVRAGTGQLLVPVPCGTGPSLGEYLAADS